MSQNKQLSTVVISRRDQRKSTVKVFLCDEKVKPSFMSQTELRMRSHFEASSIWDRTMMTRMCVGNEMKNKIELEWRVGRSVIPQWINVVKSTA